MNQVRLRTVRNIESGKEQTLSSSKAKALLRLGSYVEVETKPDQEHQPAQPARERKGFWRWLFG